MPETRPLPDPGPDEILIKVSAAGVNRPDVLQRAGAYPPPPGASDLPGLEVAGNIAAIGADVTEWRIGDPVMSLVSGGGYADYCLADRGVAMPVPAGFDMVRAAAIPETFFTVWHNVFERGALAGDEWLLVHGGSSGIGTTAIQLAKAFGARVIATAGSDEKCDACLTLGADIAVNYREQDFVEAVKTATDKRGADVILDMVGGDYIPRNHAAAAEDGRIVQIAFLQGSKVEVDFTRLMIKRLTHTGSTLRPRTTAFKRRLAGVLTEKVMPLIESGRIGPVMDQTFPLTEAAAAHARMETNTHIGKIMLTVA